MAYLILLIFSVACGYCILRYKTSAVSLEILFMLIAPCVGVGGRKFDSAYFFCIAMVFLIVIRNNGKIKYTSNIKSYGTLIVTWICAFSLGWIINNRKNSFSFIISLAGLVKTLFLVYILIYSCSFAKNKAELEKCVGYGLSYTVALNAVVVVLQKVIPTQMYKLCYQLYYSSDSSGYTSLENMNSWGGGFYKGQYYRYFGLFETPMLFSCFCILIAAFVLIQFSTKKKYFKRPKLIFLISIILGISAQCKVYFFMIPLLVCVYIIYNLKKMSHGKIVAFLVISLGTLICVIFIDKLATISALRYLKYLSKPLSAFATRFGSGEGEGFLTETLNIALKHFIVGVGPVSISGEPLSDSSYIMILHHGGLIALLSMGVFYCKLFLQNNKRDKTLNILLFSIWGMGISRTILIANAISAIVIAYLAFNNYLSRLEHNYEQTI